MRIIPVLSALFVMSLSVTYSSAAVINVPANSLTQCPQVGSALHCAVVYRFNADGSVDSLVDSTIASTDGVEDTLIGVLNLTSSRLPSLTLSSGTLGIFAFDNDGGSTVAGVGIGATYFGKYDGASIGAKDLVNTFGNIATGGFSGTVFFGTGIIAGGSGWFVLEEQVNFSAPPTVGPSTPEPSTWILLITGGVGVAFGSRRRRSV